MYSLALGKHVENILSFQNSDALHASFHNKCLDSSDLGSPIIASLPKEDDLPLPGDCYLLQRLPWQASSRGSKGEFSESLGFFPGSNRNWEDVSEKKHKKHVV